MKYHELQDKSEAELQLMLAELRTELKDLRFKVSGHQLKTVRQVRLVKKNIARILTLLNNRQK